MYNKKTADRIEQVISQKGLKKSRVAEKTGLTANQFSAILKGRRVLKADDIPLLCGALGIEPNELFDFDQKA